MGLSGNLPKERMTFEKVLQLFSGDDGAFNPSSAYLSRVTFQSMSSILNSCLIFYNTRVGSLGNHSFEKQTKNSNKIMLYVVKFYHSVLTLILVRMLIQQKYNYEPKMMRTSFAD